MYGIIKDTLLNLFSYITFSLLSEICFGFFSKDKHDNYDFSSQCNHFSYPNSIMVEINREYYPRKEHYENWTFRQSNQLIVGLPWK